MWDALGSLRIEDSGYRWGIVTSLIGCREKFTILDQNSRRFGWNEMQMEFNPLFAAKRKDGDSFSGDGMDLSESLPDQVLRKREVKARSGGNGCRPKGLRGKKKEAAFLRAKAHDQLARLVGSVEVYDPESLEVGVGMGLHFGHEYPVHP
jgi:hypothetical protein